MCHGLAQQTSPVIAGHRCRLEPAGQGLALGRTDEPRLARPEDVLGSVIGVDRLPPAAFGPVTPGTAEHQPGILAQQRRRQGVDPGIRSFEQLPTLVMEHAIDRLPVFAARIRLYRVGEGAARLEQPPGLAVGGAGLDLTELFHEHLLQVGAQHFVVTVAATIVGCRREDLPALQFLKDLLAAAAIEEGITDRPGEPRQHARPDEEPAQLGRQLVEDVAREVLASQPRPAAERGENAATLLRRLAARREVEQLQACGPPLSTTRELSELFRRQWSPVEIAEETLDFPGTKAQVFTADFEQRSRDAQA